MNAAEKLELDAWVCCNVMNLSCVTPTTKVHGVLTEEGRFFNPTGVNADAMMVLEKCIESGHTPLLSRAFHSNEQKEMFTCKDGDMGDVYAIGETLPIAICLFAKKVFSK